MAATESTLNTAPRAPAEQPPTRSRVPEAIPSVKLPLPLCSFANVASRMRCPRKFQFQPLLSGPASPTLR